MSFFQRSAAEQIGDALSLFEGVKTKVAAAVEACQSRTAEIDDQIVTLRTERAVVQGAVTRGLNALRGITALLEGSKGAE